MNRKLLLRIIAGGLYTVSALIAIQIGLIIIRGNSTFTVEGLIISILKFCTPLTIATYLIILSIEKVESRLRVMKSFILIILIFYILLLISVLYKNGFRRFDMINRAGLKNYLKWNVNLIPFKTIGRYIQFYFNDSVNTSVVIENLLGNLFLFSPMGILLPSVCERLHRFKIFLFTMIIILFLVELVQLITGSGSFDIDDIILNLIGAILFYVIWGLTLMQKILKKLYIIKEG